MEVKEEDHVTAFNSLDKKNKQKFGIRLTIQVEDVDEKIKEIEEAGGELWL